MNNNTIGTRLRKIRKENNFTIPQVSSITGISKGNLSSIENDKNKPSSDALIALSDLYNISIDYILKSEQPREYVKENNNRIYMNTYQINTSNKDLNKILESIAKAWENGDEETKGWIMVQLKRSFPEFVNSRKKSH